MKNAKKKQNDREVKDNDNWEAQQNLLGFFSLLLEVDRRINPHLYKSKKEVLWKYDRKKRTI